MPQTAPFGASRGGRKMKIHLNRFLLLFLCAFLTGCGSKAPKLSEITSSTDLEPAYKSPVNETDRFTPQSPVIYVTAKISKAAAGSRVKGEFYYLEEGEKKFAEFQTGEVEGTRYVFFELTPPENGWPAGEYKAVVSLNDSAKGETRFKVIGDAVTKKQAILSQAAKTERRSGRETGFRYRVFSNPDHGFTIQFPEKWYEGIKSTPAVAFLYLANVENDPISNINVQVVPVTLQDPSQTKEAVGIVAQQLIDQITGIAGSAVKNDEWVEVFNKEGREVVFEYPYKGKMLRQRNFLTFHDSNVIIVIYTAEEGVYDDFLPPYQKAVESLTFFEP